MLYDATMFFASQLTGKRVYGKVRIVVQLVNRLAVDGWELYGDCGEVAVSKGRKFVIRLLRSLPFVDMIQTLAHELVHAYQYISGKLVTTNDSDWYWKGKAYGQPYTSTEKDATLPWEAEASKKEKLLARKFSKLLFQ